MDFEGLTSYLPFLTSMLNTTRQSFAQSDQADFSANALDANSILSRMAAQRAIAVGRVNEQKSRIATRQLIGAQRAAMAAQGIEVNKAGDSSVDVQADAAGLGELDALTIRNNAALQAWGYNVQADDLQRRSGMTRSAGRVTSTGTFISGVMQASKMLPSSWLNFATPSAELSLSEKLDNIMG